jgi:hypothetical protein
MDFLNHREGDVVSYQVKFSSFLLYSTLTHCGNCKRLREFGEIEISRQSCRYDFEYVARRKTLKTFVWISSKNSASGDFHASPVLSVSAPLNI